jgi:hypothetical protein
MPVNRERLGPNWGCRSQWGNYKSPHCAEQGIKMVHQAKTQNFSDKRRELRFAVTGMPNANLRLPNGDDLVFFFVDASTHGVGIVIDTPIKIGENLHLTIDARNHYKLELEVRWISSVDLLTESIGVNSTLYRCGLQVNDHSVDIISILSQCENVSLEALV